MSLCGGGCRGSGVGGGDAVDCGDVGDGNGSVDGSGGNICVGGESGVYRSGVGGGSVV